MPSKSYQLVKEKISPDAINLTEAISFLKQNSRVKFDETVEVHLHLGIDPKKSEQMVRGQVTLPSGAVTKPAIVVFADNAAEQQAALTSGATAAGGDELIKQIKSDGSLRADVTIATPAMMPKVAQIAPILGPQGLMPNPKTGTVTDQPAVVIRELLAGKISFKMDQLGNIHQAVAKLSWDQDKIMANASAFIDAVRSAKPPAARGEFLKSVSIKSTMSPSLRLIG